MPIRRSLLNFASSVRNKATIVSKKRVLTKPIMTSIDTQVPDYATDSTTWFAYENDTENSKRADLFYAHSTTALGVWGNGIWVGMRWTVVTHGKMRETVVLICWWVKQARGARKPTSMHPSIARWAFDSRKRLGDDGYALGQRQNITRYGIR